MADDKVRIYKNKDRSIDDIVFEGTFIRDLHSGEAGQVEIRLDKIVVPGWDPTKSEGDIIHIEEGYIDFVGVEPGKP